MNPAIIMTGKNDIIINAICHPLTNAIIIPLPPKLILVKIDVTLFIIPWCTLDISIYILEQAYAGLFLSCHAISCYISALKYAFLALIICL